jgi:hypothetical protein
MDAGNKETENGPPMRAGDYLWDGSGEPDPEIQRLEGLLGKFRHDRPAPVFPVIARERRRQFFPRRPRLFAALAATAAVGAIAVAAFLMSREEPTPAAAAGWDVSHTGTLRIGRKTISQKEKASRLGVGQVLETDAQSRASLHADDIGQIEVDPGTRLRLLNMASGLKRIALDRGTIHAYIWATPGEFVVDTPAAVTVDLGCAYTLQVDDSGAGQVHTSLGWVGFKLNGRESFIPAGATCSTRPKMGPGTPYFEDANAPFREALKRFDFEDTISEKRASDVSIMLANSRPRDALTLWHLLARVDEDQRILVFEQLRKLSPPPEGVTKEGILRLDQPTLDLWWNALGFDDISIWRHWERSWSKLAPPDRKE